MTTETEIQIKNRKLAKMVFGNCDDGSLPPDQAIWNEELIELSTLRNQYTGDTGDVGDVESWLKAELFYYEADCGYPAHWKDFLEAEDFQHYLDTHTDAPPVISIDHDGTIQIWDGWHRIACALVRGVETMPICVGRPLEPISSMKL